MHTPHTHVTIDVLDDMGEWKCTTDVVVSTPASIIAELLGLKLRPAGWYGGLVTGVSAKYLQSVIDVDDTCRCH